MKKNISYILSIIKDAFVKACIFFTAIIILFNLLGKFMGNTSFAMNILGTLYIYDTFAINFCFMLVLASFLAGASAQIFRIKKLPALSLHIVFFILLYLDLMLVIVPFSRYSMVNQNAILLLSVAFFVVYAVVLGIIMGIKAIVNASKNKKSNYEKQFKNAE